jgi:hypothetical protein
MQTILRLTIYSCLFLCGYSCEKDAASNSNNGNIGSSQTTQAKNIQAFDSLVFNAVEDEDQYFSTFDTSFHGPTSQYDLSATQIKNVDILYIHDYNYDKPGFMNPYIASQEWYWNDDVYYYPWLDSSVNSSWYLTKLNSDEFDSAKKYDGVFEKYFNDTAVIKITSSSIFPDGGIIGGRTNVYATWGVNGDLVRTKIFAFKNVASGKRGFLRIRGDQEEGWPDFPITGFRTKVDIIKEK